MSKDLKVKELEDAIMLKHPFMFKNPGGYAIICNPQNVTRLKDGSMNIEHGFPMKNISLQKGSGDMLGWQEVEITQEMVGKTVAIFQSIEIKTLNDRIRKEQIAWYKAVERSGGIAKIWHARKDGTIDENFKKS